MIEFPKLQHTRGVSLRNICLLCDALQTRGTPVSQRALMLFGRDMGLHDFETVERKGVLSTTVRHYDYALRELELVATQNASYVLTARGEKLAELTQRHDVQPSDSKVEEADVTLPEPVRAELRQIICSSRYVRHWWLRYFMPREEFSLNELVPEGKDVIVESVSTRRRARLKTRTGKDSEDSGFRIHSYFPQWETLPLDEAGRREIHEGLRQWSLRIDLVGEIKKGWDEVFEIEPEFLSRIESHRNRLDRIYVVRKRWGAEHPIEQFEKVLFSYKELIGGSNRIHIPRLVVFLALQEGFSLKEIHDLIRRLYREKHSQYFFESASEWLLTQSSNKFPIETYVQIDGVWRTSIVVANLQAHTAPRSEREVNFP